MGEFLFGIKRDRIFTLFRYILLISIILSGCSRSKKVVTEEFKEYKKLALLEEKIKEVKISFTRPALNLDFIVDKNFKKEDLKNLIEDLSPLINQDHMDKIARKYWTKDSKVWTVYLNIYDGKIDKNDYRKNLKYRLYTDYLKKNNLGQTDENIDGYKTWYVDLEDQEILLKNYIDG